VTSQNREKAPVDSGGVSTTSAQGIRVRDTGFGDRPLGGNLEVPGKITWEE